VVLKYPLFPASSTVREVGTNPEMQKAVAIRCTSHLFIARNVSLDSNCRLGEHLNVLDDAPDRRKPWHLAQPGNLISTACNFIALTSICSNNAFCKSLASAKSCHDTQGKEISNHLLVVTIRHCLAFLSSFSIAKKLRSPSPRELSLST
jgi:hypothetical protein